MLVSQIWFSRGISNYWEDTSEKSLALWGGSLVLFAANQSETEGDESLPIGGGDLGWRTGY